MLTHPPRGERQTRTFVPTQDRPAIFAGGTLVTVSAEVEASGGRIGVGRYLSSASHPAGQRAARQRPRSVVHPDSSYVRGDEFVSFALSNMSRPSRGGTPRGSRSAVSQERGRVGAARQKSPKSALMISRCRAQSIAATQLSTSRAEETSSYRHHDLACSDQPPRLRDYRRPRTAGCADRSGARPG